MYGIWASLLIMTLGVAATAGAQVATSPLDPPGAPDDEAVLDQDANSPVPTPRRAVPRVRDGTGRVLEGGVQRRRAVIAPPVEDDIVVPGVGPIDGRSQADVEARLPFGTTPSFGTSEDGSLPRDWQTMREEQQRSSIERADERFRNAPYRASIERRPSSFARAIELGETEAAASASLTVLDMITGATTTVDIPTGTEVEVGRLLLRLLACEIPPTDSDVGDVGLVQIWDRRAGDEESAAEPDFSGWMFAESPALSALDHPRYDVWLSACNTAEG
ncbi:MAG: DUF2155 domain-containing protein [Pseudomonadota bacterium]